MASDGSALERVGDYVRENRHGMVTDLVFAVAWVTLVNVIFRVLDGPTWAYYLFMFAGVAAYFGFVYSLEAARESQGGG
jgi:4-amino-4-deoxy-L-arabinose transferase-like glycosyltransferase